MACRSCGRRIKLAAKPQTLKSPAPQTKGAQETTVKEPKDKVLAGTKTP